jgi:hypothetical protein
LVCRPLKLKIRAGVEYKNHVEKKTTLDGLTGTVTLPVTPGVTGPPLLICQTRTRLPHSVIGHTKVRLGVIIFLILERFGIMA